MAAKNLYEITGDGTRYVMADSFGGAEKAWWKLIEKIYGKADLATFDISTIRLLAHGDAIG